MWVIIGIVLMFCVLPMVCLFWLVSSYRADPMPHVVGTCAPRNSRAIKL